MVTFFLIKDSKLPSYLVYPDNQIFTDFCGDNRKKNVKYQNE